MQRTVLSARPYPIFRACILLFAFIAAAAAQPAAQVRLANQQLAQNPTPRLLHQRAAAMADLIRTDPGQALALAFDPATADRLRSRFPDSAPDIESAGEWSGEAEALVIDDFEHHVSSKALVLHTAGGRITIHGSGAVPRIRCGDIATVNGILLGRDAAARAISIRAVAGASTCSTTGPQKVAVLLVNFPSTPLPPGVTVAAVQSEFFGASGRSLSTVWNEFSYGSTSAAGTVFGPFTLPQDYTCDQTDAIRSAAIQVADGIVTWANYSRIYIVIPNAGTCAIGVGTIGCGTLISPSQGAFQASTAWIRGDIAAQGGDTVVEDLVHEGGHNLGLEHAGSLTFPGQTLGAPGVAGSVDEYGDYYATMGVEYSLDGTILFGHYDAPHKSLLGWLAPGNVQTVQSPGSFLLSAYETGSAGTQALRIRRGSSTDKWLWLEYRTSTGTDTSFAVLTSQLYSGATVHYDDPDNTSAAGYTRLLNFGAPGTTDWTRPALSGVWSDPSTDLTISVGTPNASGLPVTVSYGPACAALTPASASLASGAISSSVSVSAPAGCLWYAASAAPWITLTGAASGNGSGVVSYMVSANPSPAARTGTITIGGQNFQVTQAGSSAPPAPVSVVPNIGGAPPGPTSMFQFTFTSSTGAGSIALTDILFSTSLNLAGACPIEYAPASGILSLANDSGSSWTQGVIGTATSASNSQCTLFYAASSAVASGNTVMLSLSISFSSAFGGGKNVYASATGGSGATSGYQLLGTWNVNTTNGHAAYDFDRNGTPDLVWQDNATGQVTVNYYGGSGGVQYQGWAWLYPAPESGWHVAAVGDFNGDGVPDLVWQNDATRQVTVHYYGGPGGASDLTWNWLYPGLGASGWHVVAVADFNGDGVPDLVWQNDATRQVTVHYYGGPGGAGELTWNWLYPGLGAAGWHVVTAADFNGDGVPDLVWQNDTTRQITVHYYGGPGGATDLTWNWLYPGTTALGWHVVAAADFNRDGVPDLVWQNDSTRQVTVHYYGGPGGAADVGWNWLYPGAGAAGWSVVN